ncbi:hypothetical protein [Aquisalimonas asiatica]|uniref:Heparinase II/III-like protein n=1 Tax=Aquisalimonas asiatica TaxID=406100 RepID=A0A1H8U481_9GAMM|nr:hypothetical protein [Aquisalimonas asiatica]SEO97877.1 hypothetical protein SAMN04488052_105160 [Aquisalimonas asiatica]
MDAELANEHGRLIALAEEVANGLARLDHGTGRLPDPVTGAASPPDHYGHTFTSLALARQGHQDWDAPLCHWLAQPAGRRGHAPFNRLALYLLHGWLQGSGNASDALALVESAGRDCVEPARYASNNWVMLAAAMDVLDAPTNARADAAAARVTELASQWTTAAGAFIDLPRKPVGSRGATPLAYHHKYLLCLWLARRMRPSAALDRLLARGLNWLGVALDETGGYCGGFGRSTHALFGDTALLVVLAGVARETEDPGTRSRITGIIRAIRQRLEAQRRDDGLLWLTPARCSGADGGWDGYMFLTVYNAWFAGLTLAMQDAPAVAPFREVVDFGVDHDPEAGLASVNGPRGTALVSIRGQPPQGFSRTQAECRYVAGQLYHLGCAGQPLVPPGARVSADTLLATPWLATWTPVVEAGGLLYGCGDWQTSRCQRDGERLIVTGAGQPTALVSPQERGARRILAALDWRFLGGRLARRKGQSPAALIGHEWAWAMSVDLGAGQVVITWTLTGRAGSDARCLSLFPAPVLDHAAASWSQRVPKGEWPEPEPMPDAIPSALGWWRGMRHRPVPWPAETTVVEWTLAF